MKKFFIVFALLLFCSNISFAEQGIHGNLNFMYGEGELNSADWYPVEDQKIYAVAADIYVATVPLYFTLGYSQTDAEAKDASNKYEAQIEEYSYGGKVIIYDQRNAGDPVSIIAYVGAGVVEQRVKFMVRPNAGGNFNDSDKDKGSYLSLGFQMTFRNVLNVGVEMRETETDLYLFNNKISGNVDSLMYFMGIHF